MGDAIPLSTRIVRTAVILALFPFCISICRVSAMQIVSILSTANLQILGAFAAGICVYLILAESVFKGRMGFIETFEHELAHTIMSLLFFRRVYSFSASEQHGGRVVHSPGNILISLAPYFLPVFTIPLVILRPFVLSSAQPPVDFLIGATLAFHWRGLAKEFRFSQPDIRQSGWIVSVVLVAVLNVVILTVSLNVVAGSYAAIPTYFKIAAREGVGVYPAIWRAAGAHAANFCKTGWIPAFAGMTE